MKQKRCQIPKNKCVCEKFIPHPAHNIFCLTCGCYADAHSNEALNGAVYTRCGRVPKLGKLN